MSLTTILHAYYDWAPCDLKCRLAIAERTACRTTDLFNGAAYASLPHVTRLLPVAHVVLSIALWVVKRNFTLRSVSRGSDGVMTVAPVWG